MSIEIITLLLFSSMVLVLLSGIPISFGLGAIGVIFTIALWGVGGLFAIPLKTAHLTTNIVLTAVPLFILMGMIIEKSDIGDDLFNMFNKLVGGVAGGLAVASVGVCTLFAAMTGISGAAVVTLGIVALPAMLRRGYDKTIAIGSIMAGAALGVLIPPSVLMIIYAWIGGETSVGRLFAAGIIPGILLATLYILYILFRCKFKPNLGPPLSKEERGTSKENLASIKAVLAPVIVIIAVLGSMFGGIATPTESAAIGCISIIIISFIQRRLTWEKFRQALLGTFKANGIVLWIVLGATYFVTVYIAVGAQDLIVNLVSGLEVNRWLIVIGMQLILLVLGCFLDATGICMITVPVFVPIISSLGFDPTWFGILFVMNMEMGYLTPPFGMNLFYMKGISPKEVTIIDIYKSTAPFVGLQAIGIAIVMLFPQMAIWIPNMLYGMPK